MDRPDPAAHPGRYHRSGGPSPWYASTTERAAWAEQIRHNTAKGVDPFEVRRRVGRARIKDLYVVDLSDAETCSALGVSSAKFALDDVTGNDYSNCQDAAEKAQAAGFEGIHAPSAALEEEFTVVVFPHAMHKVTEEHSRLQRPTKKMRAFLRRIPRFPA